MNQSRTFQELLEITDEVIAAFDAVEQRPWTIEVTMIELMKQVGDLSKHVLMHERYYLADRAANPDYATSLSAVGDELADILYCVIRIARHYQIDLEVAQLHARRKELQYLGRETNF